MPTIKIRGQRQRSSFAVALGAALALSAACAPYPQSLDQCELVTTSRSDDGVCSLILDGCPAGGFAAISCAEQADGVFDCACNGFADGFPADQDIFALGPASRDPCDMDKQEAREFAAEFCD